MTDEGTSNIHGFYDRPNDGRQYEYRGTYISGSGANWDATFLYNGDEQKLSGGALLTQASLEEQVRLMIENEIEDWIEQHSKEV